MTTENKDIKPIDKFTNEDKKILSNFYRPVSPQITGNIRTGDKKLSNNHTNGSCIR